MPSATNGNNLLPKKRPLYSLYMVTLKKRIEEALSSVFSKQTLKVNVQNQKDYSQALSRLEYSVKQATNLISKEVKDGADKKDLIEALAEVRSAIQRIPTTDLSSLVASVQTVEKAVNSIQIPEVSNEDVVTQLAEIKKALSDLPGQLPKPQKIEIPKPEKVEFPTTFSMAESGSILKAINNLAEEIKAIPKNIPKEKPEKVDLSPLVKQMVKVEKALKDFKVPEMDFPASIEVSNFPPTRMPTPVTSVWINSLRGPILSTQVSVGATATQIPASNLAQRRSMIIFNNDSSKTVYIGDENVNTSDGMPVFSKQYSPALDVGDIVDVYAITTTGTADVRILETSMDDQGA